MIGLGVEYWRIVNRSGKMTKEREGDGVLLEVFKGTSKEYGSAIIIKSDGFLEEVALDNVKVKPNSLREVTPEVVFCST